MKKLLLLGTIFVSGACVNLNKSAIVNAPKKPVAEAPQAIDENSACSLLYQDLYKSNILNVTLAWGYTDGRPNSYVFNLSHQEDFLAELTRPESECSKSERPMACGFTIGDDPQVLEKQIKGPDGRTKTVRIRMIQPALSKDDDFNRQNTGQTLSSKKARYDFMAALQNPGIVFYSGHDRDGGGPDFFPPRLTRKNHTDYDWYHKNRHGFEDMVQALANSPTRPQLLGLFGCESARHFKETLTRVAPEMGILYTNDLIDMNSLEFSIREILNSLMTMKCRTPFMKGLSEVVSLAGFFQPEPETSPAP